jgi:hypothetical protein
MNMLPAKLWLPVRRDALPGDLSSSNGTELWSCTRPIVQRINPGDPMVLWPDAKDYDASCGPQWPVRSVYWDSSGRMHLDLVVMILDPSDEVRASYARTVSTGFSDIFNRARLWQQDPGSDLGKDLHRGGWRQ